MMKINHVRGHRETKGCLPELLGGCAVEWVFG